MRETEAVQVCFIEPSWMHLPAFECIRGTKLVALHTPTHLTVWYVVCVESGWITTSCWGAIAEGALPVADLCQRIGTAVVSLGGIESGHLSPSSHTPTQTFLHLAVHHVCPVLPLPLQPVVPWATSAVVAVNLLAWGCCTERAQVCVLTLNNILCC